jgi:hypothetical protein
MYKKHCNLDENTLKLKADSQYFNLRHCIISNQSAGVEPKHLMCPRPNTLSSVYCLGVILTSLHLHYCTETFCPGLPHSSLPPQGLTCSGLAAPSRISVSVSPGWNRITSTISRLVLERERQGERDIGAILGCQDNSRFILAARLEA